METSANPIAPVKCLENSNIFVWLTRATRQRKNHGGEERIHEIKALKTLASNYARYIAENITY